MTKMPVHKQTHKTTQKHAEHQDASEKNYLNYKKNYHKATNRKINAYFKQKVMNI